MKTFTAILMTALIMFAAAACTPAASNDVGATAPPASASPSPSADATEQPAGTSPIDYNQVGSDLMRSESLGAARLNMTESELLAALGQPDAQSTAEVWGADGLKHSDWTYQARGLTVNMAESSNPESEFTAYSITAEAPCDLATQKGVKIGDTKEAVLDAYGYAVEDQSDEGTKERIVAGSVFGGVIFGMKDGVVASIFIGAAAE